MGDTFYLVIRGTVTGTVPTKSGSRTFEVRAGDTFGDLAVTGRTEEERKRTATMRCKEECFLATLSRASYLKVTGGLEESAYAILRKKPARRKDSDLVLLCSFFEELELFKDLHFPMLQTACCSTMQLKTLNAGDVLFEQKEWSDGVFYILLRGRMRVEMDGHDVERYVSTKEFGTSEHALSADADKGDDRDRLRCDRTVIAMAPRTDQSLNTRVRVDGFPASWKSTHLFEVFKGLGKIETVKVFSTQRSDSTEGNRQLGDVRWAIIQFANEHVAKKASREKMVVALEEDTGLPILRANIDKDARKPLSEAFWLRVDMLAAASSEQVDVTLESSLVQQDDADRDVVLAALPRDDFVANCHQVLQEIMTILGMKPRSRTIKQLHLLKDFFSNTDVFTDLSHSNMLQRNLSRFLGVITLEPNEQLYEESTRADRLYIVIRGRLQLSSTDVPEPHPDDLSFVRTAGQTLGEEAAHSKPSQYLHTAVATVATIVALVYRDDYKRICATDDMQRTIDTFWALGVQESAPPQPGEEPVMDFDGYKQLYLRIGKVIATKERFSMPELRSSMRADWNNDLCEFGDPSADVLTHWQYTESLYQLIDEWCGGVESTKLYADLLRMLLDFSTNATESGLVLKPLNSVPCQFQKLSDMRHVASHGVMKEQQNSKIGTADQNGGSSGFKQVFFAQNLGPSITTGAPKLAGSRTTEEKQEQYFRDMFNSIDIDGSGSLDRHEVAQLSINLGRELRKHELDAAMAEMDPSGDGSVEFGGFKIWFKSLLDGDSIVRDVFTAADKDESGMIDREELRLIMKELGNPLSPVELDKAMADMDIDGTGEIDFVEFSGWWSKLSSAQILKAHGQDPHAQYYKEMFDTADTGGEGTLDREELGVLMAQLGRPIAGYELDTAMQIMDEDGSGTIDFEEFQKWFAWLTDGDMTIRKIFDSVDADGSGFLDHDEVRVALKRLCTEKDGEEMSDEQIQDAIKLMDADKSGEVDFHEFSTWWNVYEFQQRFKPDDPVVAHHRQIFDQIARKTAARHSEPGDDEAMKAASLEIMQGHGTIDARGFLGLCSELGRTLYAHEHLQALQAADLTGRSADRGPESELKFKIRFEAFMNYFHDLKHKDSVILAMFESADKEHFGVLVRDGVRRALQLFRQHQATRSVAAGVLPPNVGNISDASVGGSKQSAERQMSYVSVLQAGSDSASLSFDLEAAMDVIVTDEDVDLALSDMHEYRREKYKLERSQAHGPEANLIQPPLKGQVDFDAFRYWVTRQQSLDPAVRDTVRISKAQARKRGRRKQFFDAMVESDPQNKDAPGLVVDVPVSGRNYEIARSPTLFTPMSQRQPCSARLTAEGTVRPVITSRQPATRTRVPGGLGRGSSRRSHGQRKFHRPTIELRLSNRRPLSPAGSSAAWPPMLPTRMSTLGAKTTAARTSQEKRNDSHRQHKFDDLLYTTCDRKNFAIASERLEFGDDTIASLSHLNPACGKFKAVELRPKSAEALHRFYSSDAARLTRGSSAEAIWAVGPAGASEKRTGAKLPVGTMTRRLSQLGATTSWQSQANVRPGTASTRTHPSPSRAPSRSSDPGVPLDEPSAASLAPWCARLSSTASKLEPVPSFLDSTRGGRHYPGLGSRLNMLHVTRKEKTASIDQSDGSLVLASLDVEPLVA
eukprot:COSAG02_NODE_824_length_16741_cov_16.319733_3_plen_1657_part_00